MSDSANLYRGRIEEILARCPLGKEAPDVSPCLLEEHREHWCQQVAQWTDAIRQDTSYDPTADEMMNWYIRKLQPGERARIVYDGLFNLLIKGYELIRDNAVEGTQLEGPVFDDALSGAFDTTKKLPSAEFARSAIEEIQRRLADPLKVDVWHFPYGLSSGVDPIVRVHVNELWRGLDVFGGHYHQAGCSQARIPSFARKYINIPLTYQRLIQALQPSDGFMPGPWIWLGINLLACSDYPRSNVFESLSPISHESMANGIEFSADYLQVLKNALAHIRGIFTTSAKVTRDTSNVASEEAIHDTSNAAYVFKPLGERGYDVAFDGQELQHIPRSPNKHKGLDYIHVLLQQEAKYRRSPSLTHREMSSKEMFHAVHGEPSDYKLTDSGPPQDIMDDTASKDVQEWIRVLKERVEDPDVDLEEREECQKKLEQLKKTSSACTRPGANGKPTALTFRDDRAKQTDAIRKAIGRAIDVIRRYDEALATHFRNHIQKGGHFEYTPNSPIEWDLG